MADTPHEDFNVYCRSHAVWLIKYSAIHIQAPVFFIWYNDEHDQNRSKFLTYQNAQIFCTLSIKSLTANALNQYPTLPIKDKITTFIEGLKKFQSFSITHFDMPFLIDELDQNRMTNDLLSWITDFIYLVGDYTFNNKHSQSLTALLENAAITNVIQYYNENILWPSIDGTKVEATSRPSNPINSIELASILRKIIDQFEEKISV